MRDTPTTVLIQFAGKRLFQNLEDRFVREGLTKLHPPQGQILGLLYSRSDMSASDIQEALRISKSTVSGALSNLVELGLIEYVVSEEDRREKRIVETEKGKQYQEKAWGVLEAFRKEALKDIPEEQLETLRVVLEKVIENTKGDNRG